MAVRVVTPTGGHLDYPSGVNRPVLTGTGVGITWGCWFMLPISGMTANLNYDVFGRDFNADADAADSRETYFRIAGDNAGRPAALRPASNSRGTTGGNLFSGDNMGAGTPKPAREVPHLFLFGAVWDGAQWRAWQALCPRNGVAAWRVDSTAPHADFLGGSHAAIGRIFGLGTRPDAGMEVEHIGILLHNFPWDLANNRPNLSVVEALANGTYDYASSQVLNGGTILDWRKLLSVSDLADYSPNNRAALTLTGTLDSGSFLAPWSTPDFLALRNRPNGWVFGGMGRWRQTFRGTYQGTVTGLEYRLWSTVTGAVVPGWDWRAATGATIAAGEWSFNTAGDGFPIGHGYRLDVRAANNPALSVSSQGTFRVGAVFACMGQSQCAIVVRHSGPEGPASDLQSIRLSLSSNLANEGSGGSYALPQAVYNLNGANGFAAGFNRWWQLTNVPVMLIDNAIHGTRTDNWTDNIAYGNWNLFGDGVSAPLASGPNGSGVQTWLAILAERYVDGWIMHWGSSDTNALTGYTNRLLAVVAALDALYNARPGYVPPIMLFPNPRSVDGGNTWNMRNTQIGIAESNQRFVHASQFHDWQMDENGGPHPIGTGINITQGQAVIMQAMAGWFHNPAIPRFGPRLLRAWFTDASRNVIEIETGRQLRTLSGAAISPEIAVSENSGSSWSGTGFTTTLVGSRIRLTKTSGAWPELTTRVDYMRWIPFDTTNGANGGEAAFPAYADGFIYDTGTWRSGVKGFHLVARGGTGLAVGLKANLGPRLALAHTVPPGSVIPVAVQLWPSGTVGQGTPVEKTINITVS